MALAITVDSLDGLPDAIHSLYVEQDGKYVLDVDGGVPDVTGLKSALESERAIAKAAEKAKRELETKLAGVDIEEYRTLKEKQEALEEEKLRLAGRDKEIEEKKLALRDAAHQKQLEEKDALARTAELKAKHYADKALAGYISLGLAGSGIHSFATDEVIEAAKKIFSLDDDGNVVALDADGDPAFAEDGKTLLTIKSWSTSQALKAAKPHWFEIKGGGSGAQQYGSLRTAQDLSHLPLTQRLTEARKLARKTT